MSSEKSQPVETRAMDDAPDERKVKVNDENPKVDSKPELAQRRRSEGERKEKMNGSYDGPLSFLSQSPATVDVVAMETVSLGRHNRSYKDNLSKGVVLNVSKVVPLNYTSVVPPNDTNWLPDKGKDQEMMENYLSAKLSESSVDDRKIIDNPKAEKEDMTILRKVIFGFSFLPSVMFVLCFAVLLPCDDPPLPSPCVKEKWLLTLNDTVLTSDLTISSALLVGFWKDASGKILSLNLDTGEELWTWSMPSQPLKLDCKNFDVNNDKISDCLLFDSSGGLHAFNVSNGYVFWNASISEFDDRNPSLPIILSDCDNDGVREVAVAVSNSKIKILSNGTWVNPDIQLTGCSTIPTNLVSFSYDDVSDLVFYCEKPDGNGTVKLMRQSAWCFREVKLSFQTFELLNSFRNELDLRNTLLLPTDDGLFAWAEDRVFMFRTDGTDKWQISSKNHTVKRFLIYGNFYENEKQVALVSGDLATGAMVTLVDPESGNETLMWSTPDTEVMNVVSVSCKTKDCLLMMLKVIREDKVEQAIPTNISLLSSNADINDGIYNYQSVSSTKIISEMILLDFQKKESTETLMGKPIFKCDSGEFCELETEATKLAAFIKEEGSSKSIFVVMGRTSDDKRPNVLTQLRSIEVDEWYNSAESSTHCS